MNTFFRWILRMIFSLCLLLLLLILITAFFQIPINLTRFKSPLEAIASKALKRQVNIEKSIILSTSLKPVFTIEGLKIYNADGFTNDTFMHLNLATIQLELLPLLRKKVYISQIHVEKLQINLEKKEDDSVNWVTAGDSPAQKQTNVSPPSAKPKAQTTQFARDTLVVKKLDLRDIDIHYLGPNKKQASYQITTCNGSMLPGKPLQLDAVGNFLSFPYTLNISIASLEQFLTEKSSWMEIEAHIAQTDFVFSGNINLVEAHKSLTLATAIHGENLQDLNELLRLDLPPLPSYGVKTNFQLKKNTFFMNNLLIKTGSSSLNGEAEILRQGKKITANIKLTSPLIQINDFFFDDWSWSTEDEEKTVEKPDQENNPEKKRHILSPSVLRNFDAVLTVKSEKVLSGHDKLGSGTLSAELRDGRIAIDPLEIHLPGGLITMSASLKPGDEQSSASIKAKIQNFDIGILARREKPDTKMEGLVNLDMDLQSSAATFDQVINNGSGYFDFSGQLKNLNAGIIDLWAVNLIASIVSSTDENQSYINCAVGRWSVKDGILTPDVFFIDTGKIRICGKGQVDLNKQRVDLVIAPTPKRPEFFNLATPLEVHGTFSDINLKVRKIELVGTVIKFIASPVSVPIERVVARDIPANGNDACNVVLGPENRSNQSIAGCN